MSRGETGRGAPLHRFARTYARYRYAVLFYSLLLTLTAGPLLAAWQLAPLLRILLALNLVAAVLGLAPGRAQRLLLLVTAIALAIWIAPDSLKGGWLAAATLGFWTMLAVLAAASAVRFAMRADEVDAEHLYAALSGYLLAGVFLGVLYAVIEEISPGSLVAAAPSETARRLELTSAIYFSFVTLATLGYGDLVPKSELTRGLAVGEAVAGQLYVAVMIARLVASYVQAKGRRP